jgi:hypothetical protein
VQPRPHGHFEEVQTSGLEFFKEFDLYNKSVNEIQVDAVETAESHFAQQQDFPLLHERR